MQVAEKIPPATESSQTDLKFKQRFSDDACSASTGMDLPK